MPSPTGENKLKRFDTGEAFIAYQQQLQERDRQVLITQSDGMEWELR